MNVWNKLIRKIEKESERDCWSSEYSGNILELSVPPTREGKVDEYRKCVIQIGKVIQQIRNEHKSGTPKPAVQLFPNLMDIRLVAVLRPAENDRFTECSFSEPQYDLSIEEFLKNNTRESSVYADTLGADKEILEQLNVSGSPDQYKTFVISSIVNNPFIWVRTGYILENISAYFRKNKTTEKPEIFDNLNSSLKKNVTSRLADHRVPQAIILLRKDTLA